MKKLIGIILFGPLLFFLLNTFLTGAKSDKDDVFTCLVVGYDEAAENTDVISVLAYDKASNACSLVQIPRDTYSYFGDNYGKINRIFPTLRSHGNTKDEAMKVLRRSVEDYLGIEIDAHIGISADGFVSIVDSIGGVTVEIPADFDVSPFGGDISIGTNILDGKRAMKLVRHRASYLEGDLTRLDTQKLFFEGLFHTAFEKMDIGKIIKVLSVKNDNVTADIPFLELTRILIGNTAKLKFANLALLTLPGEALYDGDAWYYVVNRAAAKDAVSKYLFANSDNFDIRNRLTDPDNTKINSIYNKQKEGYRVFHDEVTW